MKGHRVEYIPGWDCHGLPIEMKALEGLKRDDVKAMDPMEAAIIDISAHAPSTSATTHVRCGRCDVVRANMP
jgi:isoleucyl-tRNA synthetase